MELAAMAERERILGWQNATKKNTSLEKFIEMCKEQLDGFVTARELRDILVCYEMGYSAFTACA